MLKGGVEGAAHDTALDVLRRGIDECHPEAIQAASAIGSGAAPFLPELRRVLKKTISGDSLVHFYALIAIEGLGAEARPAMPDLLRELRSPQIYGYGPAVNALASIGVDVLPEVMPLLDDEAVDTRKAALWVITKLGPKAASAAPRLERMRNDPSALVRGEAEAAPCAIGHAAR